MIRHAATEQSDLVNAVDALRDEVRVLRQVLDEIREALQWQNNNAEDFPQLLAHRPSANPLADATLPPFRLTSPRMQANEPAPDIPNGTKQQDLF